MREKSEWRAKELTKGRERLLRWSQFPTRGAPKAPNCDVCGAEARFKKASDKGQGPNCVGPPLQSRQKELARGRGRRAAGDLRQNPSRTGETIPSARALMGGSGKKKRGARSEILAEGWQGRKKHADRQRLWGRQRRRSSGDVRKNTTSIS